MKMRTAALIEAIDAEMQRITDENDAKHAKLVESWDAERANWLASDKPEKLRAGARKVLEKLRKGRPITRDDLSVFDRWDNAFRSSHNTRPAKADPNFGNLPQLRAFLLTVADETVTHSALSQVGFRRLDHLTRRAVQA